MIGLNKLVFVRHYSARDLEDDVRVVHVPPKLEEDITSWYLERDWKLECREEV